MTWWRSTMAALLLVAGLLGLPAPLLAQPPKPGGVLTVAWGIDHFAHWPYVKGLVPHHSLYSFGRMQNVWMDR